MREKIHYALYCLIGIIGMQGWKAQMAGFRECNGWFHCFPVADFTDQYDIRGLSQGVFKSLCIAVGVDANFMLADNAFAVWIEKLNGVFNRNYMACRHAASMLDHGGKSSGFARTGAADNKHETTFGKADIF